MMRVALIASPFIAVPPPRYGGTELFVANLAEGLQDRGIETVVYSNGESMVGVENRWCYPHGEWPVENGTGMFKEIDHLAWSIHDAAGHCDLIHVNSAPAIAYSRFVSRPLVCTLHHPYEQHLTAFYERYPDVHYTAISRHQASLYERLKLQIIHHGIDLRKYRLQPQKQDYLCFLGRIAPIKGTHIAIQVARRSGIPLKIAREIQPIFRDYYDSMIRPHVDGKFIEYIGEIGLEGKNQLLGGARGLLFPIQWQEPFGLVLIEAMACGTPAFAFPGGAVSEIVMEGISGSISGSMEGMASAVAAGGFDPLIVRGWVEKKFSMTGMVDRYAELYRSILDRRTESFKWRAVSVGEAAA